MLFRKSEVYKESSPIVFILQDIKLLINIDRNAAASASHRNELSILNFSLSVS